MTVVENTLDLGDLEPTLDEIQPEFGHVDIRRRVAGTMAGGNVPEAALILAFAVATHGFLSELGKDLYSGFRSSLLGVYRKARTWANGRGYAPLAIDIRYDVGPDIMFVFPPGMDADTFERAMQALLRTYPDVDRTTETNDVVMEFDSELDSWIEAYRA